MGYYTRAFCTVDQVPLMRDILVWVNAKGYNIKLDDPDGNIDTGSDNWQQVGVLYKEGKLPILVECARDDGSNECLLRQEVEEFLEEIGAFDEPNLKTEIVAHNLGMERGLGFILEDPGGAAWLLVSKLSHFLRLDKRAALYFYSNNFLGELAPLILLLVLLVICLPWVVVLLLSVIGMSFTEVNRGNMLIYLLFVYFVGIHVLIMAEPRFHLVLVPFLAVFAARGATALAQVKDNLHTSDLKLRGATRWRFVLCWVVIVLLVLNWIYELNVDLDNLRTLFAPGGNLARFTY